MPDFRLSTLSRKRLAGVHPDLVRVVERAIQIWTFAPDMIDIVQNSVHYDQHFTTNYYGFRTAWLER